MVAGETLFNDDFIRELQSDSPNLTKIKNSIMNAYIIENQSALSISEEITEEQEDLIVKWLNRVLYEHPYGRLLFWKKEIVTLPFVSPDLFHKVFQLSQFHCPVCSVGDPYPIRIIPIRISAISKQAVSNNSKKRRAFEKAIKYKLSSSKSNRAFSRGEKLCVHVVFVLGKENRDKDLDNMSKALLDALKGVLFGDDLDIVHLSLMKIKWLGQEDLVIVNIRRSSLDDHSNVVFNSMYNNWGETKFLDLNDFV
jgi:Holliday junction resolvase RusA-like endonuclease